MVVGKASIHNIMEGMESTGGVRLHNHKRKLKHRFDIIKKLGQGTYGKVQLGINKETGQEVAIKTIKKCKIETEADLIRIRREVQIMSSVQHPNIIHIYEVFENREKMVLVMEYAAGGELYDYLSKRKVLTEQEARRIFRQIAIAVYYCHKHKICHRDLKLENILLDQVGNAKIADFGLSNVFDEQKLMSTFCGSPLYASPEIVKGTPYHGPEVDCWSLGVLLYTLVYGAMPFDGSNFKRLVKQISQSDYFEPKNPSPASPLIREMLTVCPTRRADIEKICTHWWVNEGYSVNCLDIAEDLAAETPVRLDLPLFLVPRSTSAEKLIVADQQPAAEAGNNMSSETLVPTRCHSVGSLMELDQTSTDRRIRELIEEEPGTAAADDTTLAKPETDAATSDSHKSKEWAKRKSKVDEREPKAYKSASRHHSAPIPNTVNFMLGEIMEVDPTITVPTRKTADIHNIEDTAACLELIEECAERSPSKERSKTPVTVTTVEKEQFSEDVPMQEVEGPPDANHGQRKQEMDARNAADPTAPESVLPSPHKQLNSNSKLDAPDQSNLRDMVKLENQFSASQDSVNIDTTTQREFRKLKEKALSLDSELTNEAKELPPKTVERRRSKIFETAEKFNQLASGVEADKPKKIFIPGVNVGGAKRVFERKASLSSLTTPPPAKAPASKVIIDVPTEKMNEKPIDKLKQQQDSFDSDERKEEAKRRAVDIISGAIGKPPVLKKMNGSSGVLVQSQDVKKLPLKIPVGPNEIRSATVSVSTPVDTKYQLADPLAPKNLEERSCDNAHIDQPKMSSKMEITLKSATLPRPRKTSKAEISLSGVKPAPVAFKSEVEAKIDAFQPQKLRTQRSEIAFPVAAAVTHSVRSSSLEPESKLTTVGQPRERIIPIQMEGASQGQQQQTSTSPPKPPMPQRSMSQRSGSLSRQSTADSDTDSALGSTVGPEPIRKSPREYIIPIAVEGGGYVTPRSGSVEPESKTSTPTSANAPRSSRFARPRIYDRRLLSDASEDESPFSSLHRDSEDLLHRHMHRLRSSRPSRQPSEHADSLSSGEDDDDDGFELLTAENLFSRLLSRVRSLTQRLNVDDTRSTDFPASRLFARSPQAFWGLNKPMSRRLTESQFKHSLSRDGKKDAGNCSSPGTPNSSSSREHATPSRENVFEFGSNTLPRDKVDRKDIGAEETTRERLEENFTPSLARRLSRQLAEQTRRSLTRSSSVPYDKYNLPSESPVIADNTPEALLYPARAAHSLEEELRQREPSPSSSSLLESSTAGRQQGLRLRRDSGSPRRSVSLFEATGGLEDYSADERSLPSLPKHVMTLGRRYKQHAADRSRSSSLRRESFLSYRDAAHKIQEEAGEQGNPAQLPFPSGHSNPIEENRYTIENSSLSECASISLCNSTSNLPNDNNDNNDNTTSSVSVKSCETSPTDSTSNITDCVRQTSKSDSTSKSFEDRLLAAENLIKESKLKNLGPAKFNPNLCSSYTDTEKCEKESLDSISSSSANSASISKRRSCIPSLRLRSGSLTREPGSTSVVERRKSFTSSRDVLAAREQTSSSPEKSLLSRFFRGGAAAAAAAAASSPPSSSPSRTNGSNRVTGTDNKDKKDKSAAPPKQHRISRFLRPDFFDTPREESQYVKEKEAQKAAENERRKSRFIRRKAESKAAQQETGGKDAKNEINTLTKDQDRALGAAGNPPGKLDHEEARKHLEDEEELRPRGDSANPLLELAGQGSRASFLHTLEKKLESLRSSSETSSRTVGDAPLPEVPGGREAATARQTSAPPVESSAEYKIESAKLKKTRSVEELRPGKRAAPNNQPTARSKVSCMLGLFKNCEGRQSLNGHRAPSAILSKLKKSPPKSGSSKSDSVPTQNHSDDTSSSSSRIPSKTAKTDSKTAKKQQELESNRSPPKEKLKEKSLISWKERRTSTEKQPSRESMRSPEKLIPTSENTNSNSGGLSIGRMPSSKTDSGLKAEEKKNPNESGTASSSSLDDRKLAKTKKNASLVKGSSSNLDATKTEDSDKKPKKVVKPKDEPTAEKSEVEPVKKKRIVRVVKKVVKKSSDSTSESKSEGKATKPSKAQGRTLSLAKSEKTADAPPPTATIKSGSSSSSVPSISTTSKDSCSSKPQDSEAAAAADQQPTDATQVKLELELERERERELELEGKEERADAQAEGKGKQTAARSGLRLDLSGCKIPQQTFRNGGVKRDSPKSESPKRNAESKTKTEKASCANEKLGENLSDKLLECLSRMTHRASITGNKIVIEKPLRAKDVAQLKMEVSECARIIESGIADGEAAEAQKVAPANCEEERPEVPSERLDKEEYEGAACTATVDCKVLGGSTGRIVEGVRKEEEYEGGESGRNNELVGEAGDLLSPMDEAESFDSWSLSSLEFNQPRSELQSPASPSSHSPHSTGPPFGPRIDQSESVIDRIRRRSFYSRFNDRRRASLTVPPPGIALPTSHSSATLPRKYGTKISSYVSPRNRHSERSIGIDEESLAQPHRQPRKTSTSRERYTELAPSAFYLPSSGDSKLPSADYGILSSSSSSSSYDPVRRHLRSPTFDFTLSRPRYHSADLSPEAELPPTVPFRPGSGCGGGSASSTHSSFPAETFIDTPRANATPTTYSAALPWNSWKYRPTVSAEPKSIEYYEELLAPTNPDYLLARKHPMLLANEHPARSENGYHHNDNLDLRLSTRRKSHTSKLPSGEPDADRPDTQPTDGQRGKEGRRSEAGAHPPTTLDSSNGCNTAPPPSN